MQPPGYRSLLIQRQQAANLLDAHCRDRIGMADSIGIPVEQAVTWAHLRILNQYIKFLEERAAVVRITDKQG